MFREPSPIDPRSPALRSLHRAPSDAAPRPTLQTPPGTQVPLQGLALPRQGQRLGCEAVPEGSSPSPSQHCLVIYSFATAAAHWVMAIINMRGLISQSN